MKTTSNNPQVYRKDKVNEINEFIDKMPTEDENLKEKTRRGLFKSLLQDPLIQEAQKERRLDRMTSLTPEKLERMNQLFLQEEFENAKEKAQAFVYETEEEYDARINKTIAEMEKEFEEELEKKKENLSESELKLLQGYGDVEYGKIVKYKEQARKNKEYINDPNLQKCLIEIENPIQRFFSVTETHTQNNTKKHRETIMSLPSAYVGGNESLKYANLFSKENDKEDDEYGSRDVGAWGYLQVDPIGKTITLISDEGYNFPCDIFHVSYLLEKKFPGYTIDTATVPEQRNHNNYRGILNPNQYFENVGCDGSLKDYELLGNYLKMADSSLIKDTRGYAFGDFTYNLFSEAYVNVLEKSLSNDPEGKELLKLKEKSINEIKEEYPSECKDFKAKVGDIENKYQNSIGGDSDYANALIIDKAKSLNKTNDIKLIDVFNECMNIATEKYGKGKIG